MTGNLHGEYWVDGKCIEMFDTHIEIIDRGVDAVLNVTFNTDQSDTYYLGLE